ncbi:MAG TPA: hypothetical protein VFX79_03810, partial [Candidatus Saccharimonadales bacterium]|nr:hypothetical protein [Candidatus Saccharimonadales bacterium]
MLAIIALGFSLVFSAPGASAADSLFSGAKREACAGTQLTGTAADANCTADDQDRLVGTIKKGINFFSVIIGIIAVIMIIIGGFRYIISDGDSGKINTARNTIIYALVGLLLVAFAQVIVRFVLTRA